MLPQTRSESNDAGLINRAETPFSTFIRRKVDVRGADRAQLMTETTVLAASRSKLHPQTPAINRRSDPLLGGVGREARSMLCGALPPLTNLRSEGRHATGI